MAFSHIQFTDTLPHGNQLRGALRGLEDGYSRLQQILSSMTMMIDGDGSNQTQFNEVVARFGFVNTADAKAAWDELNSMNSKLTTNNSVSSVNAALLQAWNKFR